MATTSQEYILERKTGANTSEEIKIPASSVDGLSTVATSGSYNDLKDKPNLDCFCTTYTYKFSGDGSKKIFDIPHTLGEDVNVQVFLVGQQINSIDVDELVLVNTYTKKNRITIVFDNAPTAEQQFKVVVIGVEQFVGSLESADWSVISALSQHGTANKYFSIGDEKNITLSDGKTVTLQIIGFNHDDKSDGSGKAGITFGMKQLLYDTYQMNSTSTNNKGWAESTIRKTTIPTIISKLPLDLQNEIKPVNKITTKGYQDSNTQTTVDSVFLLSKVEISGTTDAGYVNEGYQYEYWSKHNTDNGRTKKLSNGTSYVNGWWSRSPYLGNVESFVYISPTGIVSAMGAKNKQGICFAFCV